MTHGFHCGCVICKVGRKVGLIKAKNVAIGEERSGCSKCGYHCQEHKCPTCGGYHRDGVSCH